MDRNEALKLGYEGALQMAATEGNLIWSAFSAILGANAVLVAAGGTFLKVFPDTRLAAGTLAAGGIIVCFIWLLVLARQFSYYRYWIACARSIEGIALRPHSRMLEVGRTYGEGAAVNLPEVPGTLRMAWIERTFRVQWLASAIILLFAALHGVVLCLAIHLSTVSSVGP